MTTARPQHAGRPSGKRGIPGPHLLAVGSLVLSLMLGGCAGPGQHGGGPTGATAPQAAAGAAPSNATSGTDARARRRATDADVPVPGVDLTPEIVFQLLASEIAAQRGQTGTATATYLALARKTRDPRLARRATELAIAERSLERATQAARLWRELAPTSALAAQTLETLWISGGRIDDAKPLIVERFARARAEGSVGESYQQLQALLLRSPDRAGALALVQALAATDLGVVQARLAVAALAQAAGRGDLAGEEAQAALKLKPDDEATVLAVARLLQAGPGGAASAMVILQAYLQRFPKAMEARFQYARLLAGSGRNADAQRELEVALHAEPESPEILYSLAQIAWQNRQPAVAVEYLKRLITLPETVRRDNAPAYLFLAQIAEEQKQYRQAIEWLTQITSGEQQLAALVRRALLLGRIGELETARSLLKGAGADSLTERVQLISAEAQLLREAQRPQESFEVLERALAEMPDNHDLLYDHAMAAERLDKLPVMEASLRKLIEARPDHAHAHNALGYSLADRGLRLEEAQQLIERALQLLPEDAHILDSMGWVLFRRGETAKAAEYLGRAYVLRPDAEIAAHLGEVLWKLGRTEEARKLWREAQGREPENQTLKETLARLNVAL